MKMLLRTTMWGITYCLFLFLMMGTMNRSFAHGGFMEVAVDTIKIDGGTITIRVDDDGTITINGKRVESGEGTYVYEFSDDDHDFVFVKPGDRSIDFFSGNWPDKDIWVDEDDQRRGVVMFRGGDGEPFRGEILRGMLRADESDDTAWHVVRPHLDDLELRHGLVSEFFVDSGELMKLENEAQNLARRARRAADEERERFKSELRAQLEEIFARKMELRQEALDKLREELMEKHEKFDSRNAVRIEIIERRLRELLGEEDAYEW